MKKLLRLIEISFFFSFNESFNFIKRDTFLKNSIRKLEIERRFIRIRKFITFSLQGSIRALE